MNVDNIIANFFKENSLREKNEKVNEYKRRNKFVEKNQVLFTGSSLMEQFAINELILNYKVNDKIYNRGIGGFVMDEFIQNIDTVCLDLCPKKIFINIGTNDLNGTEFDMDRFVLKYESILDMIINKLPNTKIYVMAYYPVNSEAANPYIKKLLENRTNEKINDVNNHIKEMVIRKGLKFIDVNEPLKDEFGRLKKEFAKDGMHFYADGYNAIIPLLIPYINE